MVFSLRNTNSQVTSIWRFKFKIMSMHTVITGDKKSGFEICLNAGSQLLSIWGQYIHMFNWEHDLFLTLCIDLRGFQAPGPTDNRYLPQYFPSTPAKDSHCSFPSKGRSPRPTGKDTYHRTSQGPSFSPYPSPASSTSSSPPLSPSTPSLTLPSNNSPSPSPSTASWKRNTTYE